MKLIFIAVLTLCLFCFSLFGIVYSCQKSENQEYELVKENLGKRVLINSDTLLIVDYFSFTKTYILSNGQRINKDVVSKIMVK